MNSAVNRDEAAAEFSALKSRCQRFTSSDMPARVRYRARAIEAMLLRAAVQRASVQRALAQRAQQQLEQLELSADQHNAVSPDEVGASRASVSSLLQSLQSALRPAEPVPDKDSTGIGFDEYLRLQESEALSAWASEDGTPDSDEVSDTELPAESGFAEMKSARRLRELRLKRHADSLVSRALAEAPEDPGPLNPEMLSIKALSNMRDLSTQYLNRFVSYIDTMLWLEKALAGSSGKPAKKAKSRRR